MDPTFADMEAKRQAEVAKAMTKCANSVNDFALHAPSTLGVTLPFMAMPVAQAQAPGTAPSAPATSSKPRKNAAAANPAAAAAANPTFAVEATATSPTKSGAKVKKAKAAKDPNAPKRPPSAYLLFQNDVRDQMKRDLGEAAPYRDVINAIAAKWKDLDPATKNEYGKAYEQAKGAYNGLLKTYEDGPQEAFAAAQLSGVPVAAPAPVPAPVAAATPSTEDTSESESDSDSSSDDDDPAPAPVKQAPPPAPVQVKPVAPPAARPSTLGAAVAAVASGSEKKSRKSQGPDGPEKKKKKKSKAVEA